MLRCFAFVLLFSVHTLAVTNYPFLAMLLDSGSILIQENPEVVFDCIHVSSSECIRLDKKEKFYQDSHLPLSSWNHSDLYSFQNKFSSKELIKSSLLVSGLDRSSQRKYFRVWLNAFMDERLKNSKRDPGLFPVYFQKSKGSLPVSVSSLDSKLSFDGKTLGVHLWAPTATEVILEWRNPQKSPDSVQENMLEADGDGFWIFHWKEEFSYVWYRFHVTRWNQITGKMEKITVTDPLSIALSPDGEWSLGADLNHQDLKPDGWDTDSLRLIPRVEDSVIYEMHLRDFTIADSGLAFEFQGKFLAFTQKKSDLVKHLKKLKRSGVTHLHLLPVLDFASVSASVKGSSGDLFEQSLLSEDPDSLCKKRFSFSLTLQKLCEPQEKVGRTRGNDLYNWGYDPVHYGVFEDSYIMGESWRASILEPREMVKAIHALGLRVVFDVVYNHTSASANHQNSILDKLVPGYFHRYDEMGRIESSTCCPDTASENLMMEKIILLTIQRFSKDYHVDGFRFDLMGHMPRNLLEKIQWMLNRDKKNGEYLLYGEGWEFGSLVSRLPAMAMTQKNAAGSGIATFNDRLRDALRGGNYQHSTLLQPGYATGIFDFKENYFGEVGEIRDLIQLSMAGNLMNYPLDDFIKKKKRGSEFIYGGRPGAGYAASPGESIQYVSAHDNHTLYDLILCKTAKIFTPWQRVRAQALALGVVALSQGIPFFHGGSEILRSKSGDGDSYDSGDEFNSVDLSLQSNGWGFGLPGAWKNESDWKIWGPLLLDDSSSVTPEMIRFCFRSFREFLEIRKNIRLFRMDNEEDVIRNLRFFQDSSFEKNGVILMEITDHRNQVDSVYKKVLVAINPGLNSATVQKDELRSSNFFLHPILKKSRDETFKQFWFSSEEGKLQIPAQSIIVLVQGRGKGGI